MKKNNYLFFVGCCILICSISCSKENKLTSDNNIISLHDSIVNLNNNSFKIDLNNDGSIDFEIYYFLMESRDMSDMRIGYNLFNGLAIATSTRRVTTNCSHYNPDLHKWDEDTPVIDTIVVPKVCKFLDAITSKDTFSNESYYIKYSISWGPDAGPICSTNLNLFDGEEEDIYFSFKKVILEDRYSLGWIKFRFIDYDSIMLKSYNPMIETNELIIQ
jgi:hypothetical protein